MVVILWHLMIGLVAGALLYQYSVGFVGLLPRLRDPEGMPALPLVVLVPAHNEARVIAGVIRSLLASEYPADRMRLVVIADHCSDETARIAAGEGAEVMERREGQGGKQHAIRWALERLAADRRWLAAVVVDADNLVHPRMLHGLSDRIQEGYAAAQAALDSRNPSSSWVSAAYAASYWVANLNCQRARARLGLTCQLGGTGSAISRWALDLVPWTPETLVDDLEYTAMLALRGLRVGYSEWPVFDEKPTTMAMSIRQRTRWMRGQAQVIVRYYLPLCARAVLHRDARAADLALSLWVPIAALGSILSALIHPSLSALFAQWALPSAAYGALYLLRAGVPLRLWVCQLAAIPYAVTWVVPICWGFATSRNRTWTHTPHVGAGMAAPGGAA